MGKKTLTVIVEESLHRDVKASAAAAGKLMTEWISEALRAALPKKAAR